MVIFLLFTIVGPYITRKTRCILAAVDHFAHKNHSAHFKPGSRNIVVDIAIGIHPQANACSSKTTTAVAPKKAARWSCMLDTGFISANIKTYPSGLELMKIHRIRSERGETLL